MSGCKISLKKWKCVNLRPKCLMGYFWARIPKRYCYIWNYHPRICAIAKFFEKTKISKFGTKNALFGCFWAGIWKQYCHIWKQHPRTSIIVKFWEKAKIPKFDTKKALFGYFSTRISAHSNLLYNSKILRKKMPKFRAENVLFGYFWAGIWKQYCHVWNQQPGICLTKKVIQKNKIAYIWDQKCLIWVFLG